MRPVICSIMLFFTLFCLRANAQNYVPNGSFEEKYSCPGLGIDKYCKCWTSYTNGPGHYYDTCVGGNIYSVPVNINGVQNACQGSAYVGFLNLTEPGNDIKAYVTSPIRTLMPDRYYIVSIHVSLADHILYGTDDLGVLFMKDGPTYVNTITVLPKTPQVSFSSFGPIIDKVNWTRLWAIFKADSAYNRIVIGGFKTFFNVTAVAVPTGAQSNSSYYYLDSVEVIPTDGIQLMYSDSILCAGDVVQVPYSIWGNGTFYQPPNIFTLQLSDSGGSFDKAISIGSVASWKSGSIKATIPLNSIPGNKYRLRIISNNPADTSGDNGKNINIGHYPENFKVTSNSPLCIGDTLLLSATSVTKSVSYSWQGAGGFTASSGMAAIPGISENAQGKYVVTASVGFCKVSDSVQVIVNQYPENLKVVSNTPVCAGDVLLLQAATTSSGVSFHWSGPGNFSSTDSAAYVSNFKAPQAGSYILTASNANCRKTISVQIDLLDPKLELGSYEVLCNGETKLLNPEILTATYLWQDGSKGSTFTIDRPGFYWVAATTKCGVLNDSLKIDYRICDCQPFIASGFTPNNDGLNDKAGVIIDCEVSSYKFEIANRFGQIVFVSSNKNEKWDGSFKGQPAEVGTYFYVLKIKGPKEKDYLFKGDITLIR